MRVDCIGCKRTQQAANADRNSLTARRPQRAQQHDLERQVLVRNINDAHGGKGYGVPSARLLKRQVAFLVQSCGRERVDEVEDPHVLATVSAGEALRRANVQM